MNDDEDDSSSLSITSAVLRVLDSGATAVLITILDKCENIGSKLLLDETGKFFGSLRDAALDELVLKQGSKFLDSREETRTFKVAEFAPDSPAAQVLLLFERIRPEPRLVICGAGHVGAALARLGSFVGYHVTLIDDRAALLRREHFPEKNIELVLAENWTTAVSEAIATGKGVAIAVVTRGHNEDEECMRAVVRVRPDYVGMIGSKRRTNIVIDRLRESGCNEDQLRQIHAPIGLDIGAISPEEVALAILAEIVSERRGATGESLSAWRREKK